MTASSSYPDYIQQLLARARGLGQWYASQADAAALCFDALTFFPDCAEASKLIYDFFCDEWLVYDMRVSIQQNIDEWDDRPWQQRRRLALSFRFLSRWHDAKGEEDDPLVRDGPPDVARFLHQAKLELIGAYCLGDEDCTDYAWAIFSEALEQAANPRHTLLWIGKIYADLGFFADSIEALNELCARFEDPSARRLLTEVLWWRDNAERLPWLPPPGDGSRYRRMMQYINPSAPDDDELIRQIRTAHQQKRRSGYRPFVASQLSLQVNIPDLASTDGTSSQPSLVDWAFLDSDDGQPGDPPDWARQQASQYGDELAAEILHDRRWTRNIPPPSTAKRYNPSEQPFDPGDFFNDF